MRVASPRENLRRRQRRRRFLQEKLRPLVLLIVLSSIAGYGGVTWVTWFGEAAGEAIDRSVDETYRENRLQPTRDERERTEVRDKARAYREFELAERGNAR